MYFFLPSFYFDGFFVLFFHFYAYAQKQPLNFKGESNQIYSLFSKKWLETTFDSRICINPPTNERIPTQCKKQSSRLGSLRDVSERDKGMTLRDSFGSSALLLVASKTVGANMTTRTSLLARSLECTSGKSMVLIFLFAAGFRRLSALYTWVTLRE